MTRSVIAIGIGTLLVTGALLCAAPEASAQVSGGPFDRMSPGNQKIARALFEAQRTDPGTQPLTLDEIAARKRSGEGWGRVFQGMRSDGLVTSRNLGQAVSDSNHRHHSAVSGSNHRNRSASSGTVTTAANRSVRTAHVAGGGSGRTHGMTASASHQGRGTVTASASPPSGNGASGASAHHGAGRGK